jgi:hypothetical protein
MRTSNGRSRWMLSVPVSLALAAGVVLAPGCVPDQWIADWPDGSTPRGGGGGSNDGSTFPVCSASEVCAEYTPNGPACLQGCARDAGVCPAGEVCTPTSGCCSAGGCSAIDVYACCPPEGCATSPEAGGAVPDGGYVPEAGPPDVVTPEPDSGFPACGADQACIEYGPSGRACMQTCSDAGECPSGQVCTSTSGCCSAGGCSAVSVNVCCPPEGCNAQAQDAGGSGPDGSAPICSAAETCVQNTPYGPSCMQRCAGLDAGGCPAGWVCTGTPGCCSGAGCLAPYTYACCPELGGCNSQWVGVAPDAGH